LWNGYIVLYIVQECGVNPLFILCSQTHDIIKLISNSKHLEICKPYIDAGQKVPSSFINMSDIDGIEEEEE